MARLDADPYPTQQPRPPLTTGAVMRWMNRFAAAVAVLVVVAGPPLLTAAWLHRYPWRPPTRTQIQTWAEQPLTAGTFIAGCVTIAVLAWAVLVTHLARRMIAEIRRRLWRARHLPMPTPAQLTASSMAGVAAFTMPAISGSEPHPLPAAADAPPLSDPAGAEADRMAAAPAGVALPGGGWIPYRTAAAIATLAALTWLYRRRSYRPDPHHPRDHRNDPDLQPLPDTVHTITTALAADEAPEPATTPAIEPDQLPHGVLRLTGPGAAAAGRGLLVTAALTTARGTSAPRIRVHPEDLPTLLPDTDMADPPSTTTGPPLSNPPEARHNPDDALHCHARPADPLAPSDLDDTGTVIVLGEHPRADVVWHVSADGLAAGTGLAEPRRLCTLDQQAAADLLTLARAGQARIPVADAQHGPANSVARITDPAYATAAYLRLLGACKLTVSGLPVRLRRTAALQVLAYLAVHPGGATGTELVRAVWPHLPPATIAGRLHTTVTELRKQLHPLLGDDPITRHEDRYLLNTGAIDTDLRRWTTAVDAVTHAVGTTAQQQACRTLLDRYRGHLAEGRSWPWLTPAREQTRRAVVDACSTLAEHADTDEALAWLQHAITVDPYNEPLHHQTAHLLHAAGDHTGAEDLLKRLHRRLADTAH